MGAEPPGTPFPADDLLRGDVLDPETSGLTGAFHPAFVDVQVGTSHDDSQTPWRAVFASDADVTEYVLGVGGERGTRNDESDAYWVVYTIGIYEGVLWMSDNDPDSEACHPGFTWAIEPEYSGINMEVLRDLGEQWICWTPADEDHVRALVVAHEIGHQFELDDDYGSTNHVMSSYGTDVEEESLAYQSMSFLESDVRKIGELQSP